MNKIYRCKISGNKFGFTNQIYTLISNIIAAYNEKKNIVIVDKFLNDISLNNYMCISEVLDIDKINIYLENKYNMLIFDKYKINLTINSVEYGFEDTVVDLTDYIVNNCYKDNYLLISKDINLNDIKGDPLPNHSKKLYINYSINNYNFTEELQEKNNKLENDFVVDLLPFEDSSKLTINSIEYGFEDTVVDLTDYIVKQCYKNHYLSISKDINLNDIKGDPLPNHSKKLYINYSVNNEVFNEELKEKNNNLENDFVIDLPFHDNLNLKINWVKYGFEDTVVDLTDYIVKQCYKNHYLSISKDINLNDIKGDPLPNHSKKLYINYSANNEIFTEELQEKNNKLENDFVIDNSSVDNSILNLFCFYCNTVMFDEIAKNIHYNNYFIDLTNEFIKDIDFNNKINIFHLRFEDDAIKHWSEINNMPIDEFKKCVENKYTKIIKRYIKKNDLTIILTSSLSNSIIDYFENNNYNYKLTKKLFDEREKNAIIDFLISQICNNIFIGSGGSTFSCYIAQNLRVKKVMFNLDKITDDEKVY